jgi:hypothetical protein
VPLVHDQAPRAFEGGGHGLGVVVARCLVCQCFVVFHLLVFLFFFLVVFPVLLVVNVSLQQGRRQSPNIRVGRLAVLVLVATATVCGCCLVVVILVVVVVVVIIVALILLVRSLATPAAASAVL